MSHIGNFRVGGIVRKMFNTQKADGTLITFGGSPAVMVYRGNNTNESAAGLTLSLDFDARTGLHLISIDTSLDSTFYSAGYEFFVVVTSGTVDGVSQVGWQVFSFSVENRMGDVEVAIAAQNTQPA